MSPEYVQIGALIALGVVVLIIAIWLLMRANRKTTILDDHTSGEPRKDVLDEGGVKAERNQALIDSPTSVAQDIGQPTVPEGAPVKQEVEKPVPAAASLIAEPAPEPALEPEPTLTSKPTPAPTADGDDLRKIKGLGPKLVTMLTEQGITSFAQIAAWSDADVERIDASLGRFAGRITRDQWVEQAKLLESGKEDAFSEKFGQK